jgi:hypothetical protein
VTKKKVPATRKKKKVPAVRLNKKPNARSLAAKKAHKAKKALFKKRSLAAKKGWRTRRKSKLSTGTTAGGKKVLISRIQELENTLKRKEIEHLAQLKTLEGYTEVTLRRYSHEIAMENLPPRMIHETALEHAGRIVKALALRGYNQDQAYSAVAHHTGVSPSEVYTLFCYVGPGEYVA